MLQFSILLALSILSSRTTKSMVQVRSHPQSVDQNNTVRTAVLHHQASTIAAVNCIVYNLYGAITSLKLGLIQKAKQELNLCSQSTAQLSSLFSIDKSAQKDRCVYNIALSLNRGISHLSKSLEIAIKQLDDPVDDPAAVQTTIDLLEQTNQFRNAFFPQFKQIDDRLIPLRNTIDRIEQEIRNLQNAEACDQSLKRQAFRYAISLIKEPAIDINATEASAFIDFFLQLQNQLRDLLLNIQKPLSDYANNETSSKIISDAIAECEKSRKAISNDLAYQLGEQLRNQRLAEANQKLKHHYNNVFFSGPLKAYRQEIEFIKNIIQASFSQCDTAIQMLQAGNVSLTRQQKYTTTFKSNIDILNTQLTSLSSSHYATPLLTNLTPSAQACINEVHTTKSTLFPPNPSLLTQLHHHVTGGTTVIAEGMEVFTDNLHDKIKQLESSFNQLGIAMGAPGQTHIDTIIDCIGRLKNADTLTVALVGEVAHALQKYNLEQIVELPAILNQIVMLIQDIAKDSSLDRALQKIDSKTLHEFLNACKNENTTDSLAAVQEICKSLQIQPFSKITLLLMRYGATIKLGLRALKAGMEQTVPSIAAYKKSIQSLHAPLNSMNEVVQSFARNQQVESLTPHEFAAGLQILAQQSQSIDALHLQYTAQLASELENGQYDESKQHCLQILNLEHCNNLEEKTFFEKLFIKEWELVARQKYLQDKEKTAYRWQQSRIQQELQTIEHSLATIGNFLILRYSKNEKTRDKIQEPLCAQKIHLYKDFAVWSYYANALQKLQQEKQELLRMKQHNKRSRWKIIALLKYIWSSLKILKQPSDEKLMLNIVTQLALEHKRNEIFLSSEDRTELNEWCKSYLKKLDGTLFAPLINQN